MALISVVIALVVLGAAAADFAYNTQVDYSSAANSRDELRAHYLARSGINLSRLLLRVQQLLIDPNMKQFGGMDIQIADYAPVLVEAFNSREGAEALGSFLGIQGEVKGLGVDVGTFDLELESLDGKLNLNCAGGTNAGSPAVVRVAASMAALMLPQRYDRLFEEPDRDGQYMDRLSMMRAIVDWADQDTVVFGTSAAEDYRYNTGEDPYEIKNHYYDSLEELRLVRGVDDDFMAAFARSFTIYGDCKINVNLASVPLLTALIIQHAADPSDPALRWDNLVAVARYVARMRDHRSGFPDLKTFAASVADPMNVVDTFSMPFAEEEEQQPSVTVPWVRGITLNEERLNEAAVAGGSRRIWRITASADVGPKGIEGGRRVQRKITAIWDMKHVSFQAQQSNMGPGGLLYWREE